MIVYEVTATVESAISADYRTWLQTHVEEILALPGFVDAVIERQLDVDEAQHERWCVRYRLQAQHALDDYLRDHAPRLRAEGVARFGARFSAQRRVLREDARLSTPTPR